MGIGQIYRPLVSKQWFLVLYFGGIIVVVPIVLMNLVTAVIVNGAMEQAEQDKVSLAVKESQYEKRMVRKLRQIFLNLDCDGSGMVSLQEIEQISLEDQQELNLLAQISDPAEIFCALDVDASG